MTDNQYTFLRLVCIGAMLVFFSLAPENCMAGVSSMYFEKCPSQSNTDFSIEVFVDIQSESIQSYDLAITFNTDALQYHSTQAGKTLGQLPPEPISHIAANTILLVGTFKSPVRGLVSLLFIHFNTMNDCKDVAFEIFAYELLNEDYPIPIEIFGYKLTNSSILRLELEQDNNLPLVDEETIKLLMPLLGKFFDQKDKFENQLLQTIGQEKIDKYLSYILTFSQIAYRDSLFLECYELNDIITSLQCLAGMHAPCRDLTGDDIVSFDDIFRCFHHVAWIPDL